MADTVELNINGDVHTVETKALTLICHKGDMNINPVSPEILVISPQATVQRADELTQEQWNQLRLVPWFVDYWKLIFPNVEPPLTLKGEGLGYRHVVGLILLMVLCIIMGKKPYVQFPESYLHPSAQVGLADLFIKLSERNAIVDRRCGTWD